MTETFEINVPQGRLYFKSVSIISNKLQLNAICYW